MKHQALASLLCATVATASMAQSETIDSIKTKELEEIVVEATLQQTSAQKSTFIPTNRQKNASQTGAELIERMGIPQLRVVADGRIETNSGKNVAVFIDFIPASDNDLKAMRMADVKRVEYYEYPSDPRLQGNQYVVNYIMAKYEYGGYIKGFGHANLLSYSEQLLGNIRFQYKKMTYDLMGYGWNMDNDHYGSELTETYRLPQEDGTVRIFDRYSNTKSSKEKRQNYFAAFKATYNSPKIQASSQINGSINRIPRSDRAGEVLYSSSIFPASEYSSTLNNSAKFISYNGYYFFTLPKNNSITFTPSYTYSHTEQNTSYIENGYSPILNGAVDNTNQIKADLKFNHSFGKFGNILAIVRGAYEYNRTKYSGTATSLDKSKSSRIGIGATYNVSVGNFYGSTGFGWDWEKMQFGDFSDNPSAPWFDLSLQYGFKEKHSVSTTFHYSTWSPSASYKSTNMIQSTPFLKYTGNPSLVPFKSYDIDLRYTWLPNNNCSLSAFGWAWMVDNRYAFDYEATSTSIVRTIKQPMGSYAQGKYGITGTLYFLNRTLVFTGQIGHVLNHNGVPYNIDHSFIDWYARVQYYLKNWNFSLTYISDNANADGCMNGIWVKNKNDWYITVGWSNSNWNIRANIINLTRWNWQSATQEMHSEWYDTFEKFYNGQSHALIQLSATYTFGFGKKVKRDNEPGVSGSAASGILK